MKKNIIYLLPLFFIFALPSCAKEKNDQLIEIASFKGAQVTGISVSSSGRVFANFPRWHEKIEFSVVEVKKDGSYQAYPNKNLNSWQLGDEISDKFISVQSVIAHNEHLYILETANPRFKGLITSPKIYIFDLNTDNLVETYDFPKDVLRDGSYVNDLRIDDKLNRIYVTDSEKAGLIVIDKKIKKYTRVLNDHKYTLADLDKLTIDGKDWIAKVHSDGIALDTKNDVLYIHALTGTMLYGIKTKDLLEENPTAFAIKTSSPDGMIIDEMGNLYFGDLEKNAINYLLPDRKTIKILTNSDKINWPDTFSIHENYLYFTNARINQVTKENLKDLEFKIFKIKI